jgi:adenosine/AMP kinase
MFCLMYKKDHNISVLSYVQKRPHYQCAVLCTKKTTISVFYLMYKKDHTINVLSYVQKRPQYQCSVLCTKKTTISVFCLMYKKDHTINVLSYVQKRPQYQCSVFSTKKTTISVLCLMYKILVVNPLMGSQPSPFYYWFNGNTDMNNKKSVQIRFHSNRTHTITKRTTA